MASPTSDAIKSITDPVITIPVNFDEHWFVGGLRNMVLNTIFQGIITVLVIKQFVAVCRLLIKGSRENQVKPNRLILWDMIESWEDLFKTARSLLFPKGSRSPEELLGNDTDDDIPGTQHGKDTGDVQPSGKLNPIGKRRVLLAALIAAVIFLADVVLIFVSLPSNRSIEGSRFQVATWDNKGNISKPTNETLIRGSLSKVIMLESKIGGAEFVSKQSFSMERTNFGDFQIPLNNSNVPLLNCTVETWRLICRVRTKTKYYQYKLRLDLTPKDSSSQYFARPNFDIGKNESKDNEYKNMIENTLKEAGAVTAHTEFRKTSKAKATNRERGQKFESELIVRITDDASVDDVFVNDRVNVTRGSKLDHSHDVIASIVINSIRILPTKTTNPKMQEREIGKRAIRRNMEINGIIAQSQRPWLPLYGALFLYLFLLAISTVLQARVFKNVHFAEIRVILGKAGHQVENVMNADVKPIDLQPRSAVVVEEKEGFQNP